MQRRIFIALNPEDKVKNFIHKKIRDWEEFFPAKWVDKDNFHITLMFIGYVDDREIPNLAQKLRKSLAEVDVFDIMLDEFKLGPDKNRPKMIWLSGEKNEHLIDLRHRIEQAVSEYNSEKKSFRPHITLARVPRKIVRQAPDLGAKKISVLFPVQSVEIMESRYENRKRKYYVMESIGLK